MAKLELVALAMVSVGFAVPFGVVTSTGTSRLTRDKPDTMLRAASTIPYADGTRFIPRTHEGNETETSDDEAFERGDAYAGSDSDWVFLVHRTFSRLIWLAAENFVITRPLGRWHAEWTGQVDSHDAFIASARTSIRESWDGLRTMAETLPAQLLDNPSQAPMFAGALVVSAVTGVLYPLQAASSMVYGTDEEAGGVAGGIIIDAWTTKAFAAAGLGTRVLKTQRIARLWQRAIQKVDNLGATFVPRSRPFAHAHASAHVFASAHATPHAPARAPDTLAIRHVDSNGSGGRYPTHSSTAISDDALARRVQHLRSLLPNLELETRTLRVAAHSETFAANLEMAVKQGPIQPRGRFDMPPRRIEEPTLLRGDTYALHFLSRDSELARLSHLAATTSARTYPVPRLNHVVGVSFEGYLERVMPDIVRRTGQGVTGRIRVGNELRSARQSERSLDTAFGVSPEMQRVHEVGRITRDFRLAQEELGLLYLKHGFGEYRNWEPLRAQIERLDGYYKQTRAGGTTPRNGSRQNVESNASASRAITQQFESYRAELEAHLGLLRAFRQRRYSDPPSEEALRYGKLVPISILKEAEISRLTAARGVFSPKLVEDTRASLADGWKFHGWSPITRFIGRPHYDDVPGRLGRPGESLVVGDGYERLASLAQKAGAARYAVPETFSRRRMSERRYVDSNLVHAGLREGEGILRSLEVRDELLGAVRNGRISGNPASHEERIRQSFDIYGAQADAIYAEFLRTGDRSRAREALGRLYVQKRRTEGEDVEATWRHQYEHQYKERRAEMEFWGWW